MYVIVIGCGRLGSSLAMELSDSGHDVCVIDRNKERLETLGSGFNGQRIGGIEFDGDNLIEGGIRQADALLAVTSDDNVNITVALIASRIYHVPKVIARVNVPNRRYIYDKLNIDTISPVQLGVEMLLSRMDISKAEVLSPLGDNYELINLAVCKENLITTVSETERNYHCIVSAIIRENKFIFPAKEELIHCGDHILCTVDTQHKEQLLKTYSKEITIWNL